MRSRILLTVALVAVLSPATLSQGDLDLNPAPEVGPLAPLEGVVSTPEGEPAVGAVVALYGYESHSSGGGFYLERDPVKSTVTNEVGRFVFTSFKGLRFPGATMVYLLVQAEGYGPTGRAMVSYGDWDDPVRLQLPRSAELVLRIKPCRWKTMVVADTSELRRRVHLDSKCEAHIFGLASGRTYLKPWSDNHGDLGTGYGIVLLPHQLNEVDLELRANSIQGIVLSSGQPKVGVDVIARYIQPGEIGVAFERTTDSNGEFAFYDLDLGLWRVYADGNKDGATDVVLSREQDARVEIELKKP